MATIAVIAAILFPVFAQAREKARQTACLSNLRQIGTAVQMYAQDYDESIVPAYSSDWEGRNRVSWPTLILPYVKNVDVFVCPGGSESPASVNTKYVSPANRFYIGVTRGNATVGGDGSDPRLSLVPRLSYSRNLIPTTTNAPWDALISGRPANNGKTYLGFVDYAHNLKSGWVGRGTTDTRSLAEIAEPADTIHIVDGMAGVAPGVDSRSYGDSMRGLPQDIRTDMFNDSTPSKAAPRHAGGFAILYGDGHAGYKKWGSTTPCQWTIQEDRCP